MRTSQSKRPSRFARRGFINSGVNRTICRSRRSERCPCKRLPGSEPAVRKICGVATANGVDLTRSSGRIKQEIANSRQKARSFPIWRLDPNKFYFLLMVWGLVDLYFFALTLRG